MSWSWPWKIVAQDTGSGTASNGSVVVTGVVEGPITVEGPRQPPAKSKYRRRVQGLAPSTLVGLLETGRAVLLSQALDTRYDLADLREARPELAVRFIELRKLLDQPTDAAPPIERRVAAAQVRQDLQEGVTELELVVS